MARLEGAWSCLVSGGVLGWVLKAPSSGNNSKTLWLVFTKISHGFPNFQQYWEQRATCRKWWFSEQNPTTSNTQRVRCLPHDKYYQFLEQPQLKVEPEEVGECTSLDLRTGWELPGFQNFPKQGCVMYLKLSPFLTVSPCKSSLTTE